LAQGRVWTGAQARDLGLIDKTGTFQDAIEASARIAGLGDKYQIEWIEPEQSALDEFFTDFMTGAITHLNLSISAPASLPISWLQTMFDDLQFIVTQQGKFTVAAHCLCDI
jgi:protease-4